MRNRDLKIVEGCAKNIASEYIFSLENSIIHGNKKTTKRSKTDNYHANAHKSQM